MKACSIEVGLSMVDDKTAELVKKIRKAWKTSDDKRDAGLPHDIPNVKRIDNIQYGSDRNWNLLDLYSSENVSGKLPVIINVHGGAWIYGTKATYQYYGLGLAKRGFAFVNPSYKLGPDVQFPVELDQVNQYVHWVDENADKYNLDRNNVFMVGDSAGGNLVEQYVACLTNSKYRKKFGYDLTNLKFKAVALNSPATFLFESGILSVEPFAKAVSAYFTPEVMAKPETKDLMQVENYITKDFLPTFLTTANRDPIHDCAARLDGFLKAKGVEEVYKSFGDDQHPEPHVFLINQKDDLAKRANDEEAEFFKKHMKK